VIKARAGRTAGVVDGITFADIRVGWVIYGILINACDPTYHVLQQGLKCAPTAQLAEGSAGPALTPPVIKRVTYRDVQIQHANTSILFFGSSLAKTAVTPMGPLELHNVTVMMEAVGYCGDGASATCRSNSADRRAFRACHCNRVKTAGVVCQATADLIVSNVTVNGTAPDWHGGGCVVTQVP